MLIEFAIIGATVNSNVCCFTSESWAYFWTFDAKQQRNKLKGLTRSAEDGCSIVDVSPEPAPLCVVPYSHFRRPACVGIPASIT